MHEPVTGDSVIEKAGSAPYYQFSVIGGLPRKSDARSEVAQWRMARDGSSIVIYLNTGGYAAVMGKKVVRHHISNKTGCA